MVTVKSRFIFKYSKALSGGIPQKIEPKCLKYYYALFCENYYFHLHENYLAQELRESGSTRFRFHLSYKLIRVALGNFPLSHSFQFAVCYYLSYRALVCYGNI